MTGNQPPQPVPVPCGSCNGSGQKDKIVQTREGPQPVSGPCDDCAGSGRA